MSQSQILPGLYIGDEAASHLDRYDVVVNCTTHIGFIPNKHGRIHIRLSLDDPQQEDGIENGKLVRYRDLLRYIGQLYIGGKSVLFHCHAGIQRSPSACAIMLFSIGISDPIALILAKRPVSFYYGTRYHFRPALLALLKK